MQFWNELEGRVIHGRHPLTRLVRSEGRTAWFESEAGDPAGTPATISMVEALTDADEVTERLQAAQSLQQPNLVTISKVGQVTLDDTLFVYAVMDHIEQSLADVLQSQALTAEEGREVAEALVAALHAIHEKGWSHGHVEAASVLATENAVQLRSDCLQLNPSAQGDDVAGVGATLFHAFTQRKALSATDAQINRIPAPFAEIVRNTFAKRWSLAQVANALKPAAAVPPPVAAAPVPVQAAPPAPKPPAPKPAPVPEPGRPAAPVVPPVAAPAARLEPLPPQTERFEAAPEARPEPADGKPKPFLLYGAIAVVVLAVLAFLMFRPHTATEPAEKAAAPTPAAPADTTPAPAATPAPVAKKPSAVSKPSPVAPSPVAKSPAAKPSPAATTPPAGNGRTIWRVIAYTYRYEKPAQEMVDKLKTQHPNLDVAVFSPGKTGVYLISLGGAMTHQEALKMLDKATSMGLPADTFVRNFSE